MADCDLSCAYVEGSDVKYDVSVDENTTGFALRNQVAQKACIVEYSYTQVWVVNADIAYPIPVTSKVRTVYMNVIEEARALFTERTKTVKKIPLFEFPVLKLRAAAAFLPIYERKIKDIRTLRLIAACIEQEMLRGWYMLSNDDLIHVLAVKMQMKKLDVPAKDFKKFVEKSMETMVPAYKLKQKKAAWWSAQVLKVLTDEMPPKMESEKAEGITLLLFLATLRRSPYYGAFFIECTIQNINPKLFDPALVAVAHSGVYVFVQDEKGEYGEADVYAFPGSSIYLRGDGSTRIVTLRSPTTRAMKEITMQARFAVLMEQLIRAHVRLEEAYTVAIQTEIMREQSGMTSVEGSMASPSFTTGIEIGGEVPPPNVTLNMYTMLPVETKPVGPQSVRVPIRGGSGVLPTGGGVSASLPRTNPMGSFAAQYSYSSPNLLGGAEMSLPGLGPNNLEYGSPVSSSSSGSMYQSPSPIHRHQQPPPPQGLAYMGGSQPAYPGLSPLMTDISTSSLPGLDTALPESSPVPSAPIASRTAAEIESIMNELNV